MTRAFARGCAAAAILFAVSTASAHAGAARTHDGLLLRLSAGFGSAGTKIEDATGSIDLSGVAGDLNFAIGGMVAENFAIHATIFGWSATDPDADVTITGLGTVSGTLNATATMAAIGPGVTYYLMPHNVYLSGSVGFGQFSLEGDDATGETDMGLALDLTAGKEWWVGDGWGLGLSGGFTYHSLPDKDVDENWAGPSYAIRFSATFN